MRGSLIALAAWLALVEIGAAETFPYTATVTSLNVIARSAPTYSAYPTERLAKHSQVEVVQEGEKGFVGIRPPSDAFDWVPGSAIKLTDDRKQGEIIVESVSAYIGSNLKKVDEHLSQGELKSGDKVQILAEKAVPHADGTSETWFKIVPPPLEIRWVQAKHLSTQSPEQLADAETADRLAREDRYRRENTIDPPGLLANLGIGREPAEEDQDVEVARAQFLRRGKTPLLTRQPRDDDKRKQDEPLSSIEIEGAPNDDVGSDLVEESPRRTEARPAPIERPAPPERPSRLPFRSRVSLDPSTLPTRDRPLTARDTARATPKVEVPRVEVPTRTSPAPQIPSNSLPLPIPEYPTSVPSNPAPTPPATSGTQVRPIDSEEFKKRLTQLDVDLTSMVADDTSKWNLSPLKQRAEELLEQGASPLERGRARLLLDRISEFAATLPPGQEELVLAAPANQPAATALPKQPDFVTQYDAVGYLMPIVGARPGSPQYQLTDKDGRSLALVSARPGINLNSYVKKQVGLYGQRGYVESLKKQHVVAERVVDLDVKRR